MNMVEFIRQFIVKMKNDLTTSFRRASARAIMAFMLTVGAVTPVVNAYAQAPQLPPPAAQAVFVAEEAAQTGKTSVEFTVVKDLDALVKKYPFLTDIRARLTQLDQERLEGLKEINAEKDYHAGTFELGTFTDSANGREMVMVHFFNSPNACAYDGCGLAVFLKDAKDFRQVMEVNTNVPIEVTSTKDGLSITLPPAQGNGALVMKYDDKTGQFEFPGSEPAVPAPAPAPKTP